MRRGSVHGLIVDPTWAPPTPALDYGLSPEVKQSTMSSLWSATSHIPFDVWVAASITPGTPSLPKRVDRFAGTRSSVPRPATGPAPPASKTDPMLTEALSTPSLKAAVDELLAALRPTQLALDHREKVITFVQLVLSATLGVKVVPHGYTWWIDVVTVCLLADERTGRSRYEHSCPTATSTCRRSSRGTMTRAGSSA